MLIELEVVDAVVLIVELVVLTELEVVDTELDVVDTELDVVLTEVEVVVFVLDVVLTVVENVVDDEDVDDVVVDPVVLVVVGQWTLLKFPFTVGDKASPVPFWALPTRPTFPFIVIPPSISD